jgi:hypothetical protein
VFVVVYVCVCEYVFVFDCVFVCTCVSVCVWWREKEAGWVVDEVNW